MQYATALLSIFLGSVAQVLLKKGAGSVENAGISLLLEVFKNKFLFWGLACYGLSAILWISVLTKMKLSIAYPLVSLGYVFTLVFAFLFLKENIQLNQVIGVAVIIIGVITLSR